MLYIVFVVMAALVALGSLALGYLSANLTWPLLFMGLACLLGILARVEQARVNHIELMRALSPKPRESRPAPMPQPSSSSSQSR